MAVSTVFQTYLTSFIINPGMDSQIENMDELLASGMKYGYLKHLDLYFTNNTDTHSRTILKNRVECSDLVLCVKWVGIHRNISLLFSQVLEEYMRAKSTLVQDTDRSLLCKIADGGVLPITYGMVMPKRSPLLPHVNEILSRIFESGIFLKWAADSFELERINAKAFHIPSLADDYQRFNLDHMQSAFYVLLFGVILSVMTFIIQLIYQRKPAF